MKSKTINWILLVATAVIAFATVAIPVWLIQPFASQTENTLTVSYQLRSWSPVATIILAIIGLFLSGRIFLLSKYRFTNILLIFPLLLVGFSVWFAHQNHFLWMFNPITNAKYVSANDANFVKDDEMVLAVKVNGEAVAYPILQMAYHHIVQDVVGGQPITATY